MGRPFSEYLGDGPLYCCERCRVPIVKKEALLSKAFHACTGKAYLFHYAANVFAGPKEERMMTTGMHAVSDVFCISCSRCIGWRYIRAHDKSQKYKEGKVCLERNRIVLTYGSKDSVNSDSDDYC